MCLCEQKWWRWARCMEWLDGVLDVVYLQFGFMILDGLVVLEWLFGGLLWVVKDD